MPLESKRQRDAICDAADDLYLLMEYADKHKVPLEQLVLLYASKRIEKELASISCSMPSCS